MKVLVVGCGSIGKRHIENINSLGYEVYAVDVNKALLENIKPTVKEVFTSLEEALDKVKPQVAFICTYSNDHVKPAVLCAQAGCHLFIEKPLSIDLNGVDELEKIIKDKSLISMVGCNMRFHPGVEYLYDCLKNNLDCSKPLWVNLEVGYYLPFAKSDYESHYMANKSMGGNIIFDMIPITH